MKMALIIIITTYIVFDNDVGDEFELTVQHKVQCNLHVTGMRDQYAFSRMLIRRMLVFFRFSIDVHQLMHTA